MADKRKKIDDATPVGSPVRRKQVDWLDSEAQSNLAEFFKILDEWAGKEELDSDE